MFKIKLNIGRLVSYSRAKYIYKDTSIISTSNTVLNKNNIKLNCILKYKIKVKKNLGLRKIYIPEITNTITIIVKQNRIFFRNAVHLCGKCKHLTKQILRKTDKFRAHGHIVNFRLETRMSLISVDGRFP